MVDAALRTAAGRVAASNQWSAPHTLTVLREYDRFVQLAHEHPGVPLVPALDVDLLWHEHLDTTTSAEDCARVPSHGAGRTTDHDARYATTLALYRDRFGEPAAVWSTPAECQVDNEEPPSGDR